MVHHITCLALQPDGVIGKWETLQKHPLSSETGWERPPNQRLQRVQGSKVQEGAAGASSKMGAGLEAAGGGAADVCEDLIPAGSVAAVQEELAGTFSLSWIFGIAGRGASGAVFMVR